ncbi:uncharacterized protein LOC122082107 [Macadamia integrifolia]|uniref:uncharacterized protein LOC122082107 n=1 Tax=Macadamia integrifolia TaxID=60698 RepID=UPI001C5016CE|nr:uncharacterized protein LOC122082107 [Macadamia integrifolia]
MGNFLCKIITKVLALRLLVYLPRLTSNEQGAFQKGEIIHTNINLASELANMMPAMTRGGGMGIKIDIKKAFDTIDWEILVSVLSRGLNDLIREKKIKALHGPRGVQPPGHMMFIDDIFIITNASISLEKSKLSMENIPAARKQTIGFELGIPIYSMPTKYLGVEIFKGKVKKEALLPVMDNVKARLSGWKGDYSLWLVE